MKPAYQTMIWGRQIVEIENTLDEIAEAGFKGVEFAQRGAHILHKGEPVEAGLLKEMMNSRDLQLVGLAGGMLEERVAFCEAGLEPQYLDVEAWSPYCETLADRGFALALHAHVYRAVRGLDGALSLLDQHESLKWLPDTGHLAVAGDDLVKAVTCRPDRLVGVHLKDWTPVFGRASHRYARGFVELGEGKLHLDRVVESLRALKFDGWILAEQATSHADPSLSLRKSALWLHKHGIIQHQPSDAPARRRGFFPTTVGSSDDLNQTDAALETAILEEMEASSIDAPTKDYSIVARGLYRRFRCRLVTIFTCNYTRGDLSLVGHYPEKTKLSGRSLSVERSLSGTTSLRGEITHFDLTESNPGERYGRAGLAFSDPDLIKQLGLTEMVSIPIVDPYNAYHVRFVFNIFPPKPLRGQSASRLLEFSSRCASLAERRLDEYCSLCATRVNLLAGETKGLLEFLDPFILLVQELLGCEGVTLFVPNLDHNRLESLATSGLNWHVPEERRFYDFGEGLVGYAWKHNEYLLTPSITGKELPAQKSEEANTSAEVYCLLAPLADAAGQVRAVLRCRNKKYHSPGVVTAFSDDDLTRISVLALARPQYTSAPARMPRLFALNPAHQLRR